MTAADEYKSFVTHPRYGQRPRISGLNPETDFASGKPFLHWNASIESRIPNTAVVADVSKQRPATVPVTHYLDVKRRCRDCDRPFIFFAEEQKYWYEELGFPLEVDCVRCIDCRKRQHGLERNRERYEELFNVADRTLAQDLEMAECSLSLVEAGAFHQHHLQRVRMILKRLSDCPEPRIQDVWKRVFALERKADS